MIKKTPSAASPDAYVAAFDGWRRKAIEALHSAVRAAAKLEEVIKWGHPAYFSNGPVLLVRGRQ